MKHICLFVIVSILTGCATFSSVQKDEISDNNGTTHTLSTACRASSFFAGKSDIAKWKAQQSSRAQGASVGGLVVDSDAGTNTSAVAAAIVKAAIEATVKP